MEREKDYINEEKNNADGVAAAAAASDTSCDS